MGKKWFKLGVIALAASFLLGACGADTSTIPTQIDQDNNGFGSLPVPTETPTPSLAAASLKAFSVKIKADTIPSVGGTMSCAGETTSEDDGEKKNISYEYFWKIHETSSDSNPKILEANTQRIAITKDLSRKYVSCVVKAISGESAVTSSESDKVLVINSSPVFLTMADPSGGKDAIPSGEQLSCEGVIADDPDGDKVSISYKWSKSPAPLGPWRDAGQGEKWTPSTALIGLYVRCDATAADAFGRSTTVSSKAVQVENGKPLAFASSLSILSEGSYGSQPNGPNGEIQASVGGKISCAGTSSDPDGGSLSYFVRWKMSLVGAAGPFVNIPLLVGQPSSDGFYPYFLASDLSLTGDLTGAFVRCDIKAVDPLGAETVSSLSGVFYQVNTPPPAFSSSMIGSSASVGDPLTCAGEQPVDPDGRDLSIVYEWQSSPGTGFENYVTLEAAKERVYVLPSEASLQKIRCRAIAKDDFEAETTSSWSNAVTVKNVKPDYFQAGVTPSAVYVGQQIGCSGTTTDAGGGALSYETRWYMGPTEGGPWSEVMSERGADMITVDQSRMHKFFACKRKATDGVDDMFSCRLHARS